MTIKFVIVFHCDHYQRHSLWRLVPKVGDTTSIHFKSCDSCAAAIEAAIDTLEQIEDPE